MHRYPPGGRSKATATTLCQKCLQRGHYSYECKAQTQDRPYQSRPSRTQQLANPKLAPKLTSDTPNDLLRKKGVADEQLAKKEEERKLLAITEDRRPSRRSRSRASSWSSSVSTISTNESRSPSPRKRPAPADRYYTSQHQDDFDMVPSYANSEARKRRRSSSGSAVSDQSYGRNTRRRRSSMSPGERGRGRGPRARSPSHSRSPPPRRKRQSRSPSTRARARKARRSRSWSRRRSTSRSLSRSPFRPGRRETAKGQQNGRPSRFDQRESPARSMGNGRAERALPQPVPRQRSLSPFSKRVALTQSMNR